MEVPYSILCRLCSDSKMLGTKESNTLSGADSGGYLYILHCHWWVHADCRCNHEHYPKVQTGKCIWKRCWLRNWSMVACTNFRNYFRVQQQHSGTELANKKSRSYDLLFYSTKHLLRPSEEPTTSHMTHPSINTPSRFFVHPEPIMSL